jgi:peptidoglycan/LPS O-acetylase OafA/YrhL
MRRVPELDAIRGLAAVSVVIFHLWFLGQMQDVGSLAVLQFAVDMFFILSGLLITSIILRHGDKRGFLLNFYMRRSLRIWPIYYLALLTVAVVVRFLPSRPSLGWLPFYLTFTQNIQNYWFAPAPAPDYLGHFWTLAIEEQFYLFWPALLLLLGRRWLIPLCMALLAMSLGARLAGFHEKILIARCDGFAMGGLLAYLSHIGTPQQYPRQWRLACGVMLAVALVALVVTWRVRPLHLTFINLTFASVLGLVLGLIGHPIVAPLRDRRLVYLGVISYGLYLYHPMLFSLFDTLGRHWLLDVLKVAALLALASLSWTFIERPILRLKDRFEYNAERRSPRLVPEASIAEPVNSREIRLP